MTHFIPEIRRVAMEGDRKYHNHAAATVINGKIVCVNRNVSNRNTSHLLKRLVWPDKIICLNHHAEMNAIHFHALQFYKKVGAKNLRTFLARQKITLVVMRFNRHGEMKNSMPCSMCRKLMLAVGIKKVIYSTDEGILIKQKPHKISQNYESTGTRYVAHL